MSRRVVVTGGTGFIGGKVVRALVARGDAVTVLTRDAAAARPRVPQGVRLERWDASGSFDGNPVSGHDAVVHLAGEQAVGRRWTEARKREILESRVRSTEAVVRAMETAAERPSVLVSASAVGYYGARGDVPLDEHAEAGSDFLARVTVEWEAAAQRAEALGVRVVRARFGIVFAKDGGALAEMVKPFRMFVGGPIGSGKQVVSWIHAEDAVRAVLACLDYTDIAGPVNVTAPGAVTNEELSHTIGRVLHRPSSFRVPAAALRLRFGEGAEPIVTGQRAVPAVLEGRGFSFRYPTIDVALADVLG